MYFDGGLRKCISSMAIVLLHNICFVAWNPGTGYGTSSTTHLKPTHIPQLKTKYLLHETRSVHLLTPDTIPGYVHWRVDSTV